MYVCLDKVLGADTGAELMSGNVRCFCRVSSRKPFMAFAHM